MVWNIVPVGSIPANNNKSIVFRSSHIVSFHPTSFSFIRLHFFRTTSFLFIPHRFLSSYIVFICLTSFSFVYFVSIRPISFPFVSLRFHSSYFVFICPTFYFILFHFLSILSFQKHHPLSTFKQSFLLRVRLCSRRREWRIREENSSKSLTAYRFNSSSISIISSTRVIKISMLDFENFWTLLLRRRLNLCQRYK